MDSLVSRTLSAAAASRSSCSSSAAAEAPCHMPLVFSAASSGTMIDAAACGSCCRSAARPASVADRSHSTPAAAAAMRVARSCASLQAGDPSAVRVVAHAIGTAT